MAVAVNSALPENNKIYFQERERYQYDDTRKKYSQKRAAHISFMQLDKTFSEVTQISRLVRKGDRVLVNGSALEKKKEGNFLGTVQYVGLTDNRISAPKMRIGVCLYDNVYSSHNGVYQGKRYFFCPRGHGAMVKLSDIKPLDRVAQMWPLTGNQMFPSYEGIKERRKLREQKIKEVEEKLSKEYEANRRIPMKRVSKSATQLLISDKTNKDLVTGDNHTQKCNMVEKSLEELQLKQMTKRFGGDERAERMACTLRKLQKAFETGCKMVIQEKKL